MRRKWLQLGNLGLQQHECCWCPDDIEQKGSGCLWKKELEIGWSDQKNS
jgi:hypothetical protein